MKAFLIFAILAVFAAAGGYLKSDDIADGIASKYGGDVLNNPYKILALIQGMGIGWYLCLWSSLFGGNYTSCMYTHIYYALA
jgi:hypothetical protein